MKTLDSQQLFALLKDNIKSDLKGDMSVDFLGTKIAINDKSPLGYMLQSWLAEWLRKNGIYCREPSNSQEFPDLFLSPDHEIEHLVEFKVFDGDKSPNFDVANFQAYCRSLKTKAYRIDADYLIFSYHLENGKFNIKDMWLKKIWEITCPSERYPIKCQVKQNMIYNIRPAVWFSSSAGYKPFGTKLEFLQALHETLLKYPNTLEESANWLKEVNQNYLLHTGKLLIKD